MSKICLIFDKCVVCVKSVQILVQLFLKLLEASKTQQILLVETGGQFHKSWVQGANHRDSYIKVGHKAQIALYASKNFSKVGRRMQNSLWNRPQDHLGVGIKTYDRSYGVRTKRQIYANVLDIEFRLFHLKSKMLQGRIH